MVLTFMCGRYNVQKEAQELKVAFSESATCLSNLQNDYPKSLSWTWNLNFPPITVKNLFKFKAQDSDLEYRFWRFEKRIVLSK